MEQTAPKKTRNKRRTCDFEKLSKTDKRRLLDAAKNDKPGEFPFPIFQLNGFDEPQMVQPVRTAETDCRQMQICMTPPLLPHFTEPTCIAMDHLETDLQITVDIQEDDYRSKDLFCNENYVVDDENVDHPSHTTGHEHEMPPDTPLYEGASCNLDEVMLAVLSFSMNHGLSGSCLEDLLHLLKLILPEDSNLMTTSYSFFKNLSQFKTNSKRHYFCSTCHSNLNSKEAGCERCDPGHGVDYFITLSVIEQLRNLFQIPGFYNNLSTEQSQN
ncbi:hypothetical protein FOCC_FOCC006570 [Frankliniella occidentalis]|nr:hypothetical protein FOCC_FOCC006570 [Frankliniella occidentalis]